MYALSTKIRTGGVWCEGLGVMASAERKPITEVWGQSPQRGPEAEPLNLKAFSLLDIQRSSKICTFWYFGLFNAYRLCLLYTSDAADE